MSKRAERIQKEISIERVLYDLGYPVMSGGGREFQFPCDLHGDGNDGKFSARVYPDTASWYCFACGKSRDAIETYRDKFGLDFNKACETIEKKYGLPVFRYTPRNKKAPQLKNTSKEDYEKMQKRVQSLLSFLDQRTDLEKVLSWWEAYDLIVWQVTEEKWTPQKGFEALNRILKGVKDDNNSHQKAI